MVCGLRTERVPRVRSANEDRQNGTTVVSGKGQSSGRKHQLGKREKARRARRSKHNSHLKATYGITIDDYDAILKAQGGTCDICNGGTSKRHFAVDHNHKNGQVRGLLCARCNSGLAKFMDDITRLRRAVRYMKADGEKVNKILERE